MDYPEMFSEQSRQALQDAAARLIESIQRHTGVVSGMSGRTTENEAQWAANEQVARAVAAWNDRAFDHTGTNPVLLVDLDDDSEDPGDLEEADDGLVLAGVVSIVSRWDVGVVDPDALLAAGRAAHLRLATQEMDEDAAIAVPDAVAALYAVTHEAGEPWFDVPGVEVLCGAKVYIVPDDPRSPDLESENMLDAVVVPSGSVVFSEAHL
jgi:hypothetical protein